jgi:hypothetical protein
MAREDTQFKKGNPGGPGRPKGARSKLSEAFLQTLCDDFTEHGIEVIEKIREKQPAEYAKIIGRLMPKLMELSGPDGTDIPVSGKVRFVGKPTE